MIESNPDIGKYIDKINNLSNDEILFLINAQHKPTNPRDFVPVDSLNRKLGAKYFTIHPWLAISRSENGVYCLPCSIFSNRRAVKEKYYDGTQIPSILVTKPLIKFKNISGSVKNNDLLKHELSNFHKTCCSTLKEFKRIQSSSKTKSISEIAQSDMAETRVKISNGVKTIFRSMIFLAKQNIPLRGHREILSKQISEQNAENNGNLM